MMKAANTAGTLMKRKNWSTESIVVSPKTTAKTKAPSLAALLHPLRNVLIGRQKLIGNSGPADREQRQKRNHAQKFHGRKVSSDCGQKRQSPVQFRDDPGKDHGRARARIPCISKRSSGDSGGERHMLTMFPFCSNFNLWASRDLSS